MNPLCLCLLLLPIVCVLSYPVQYQVDREQQNDELPKEFWSRHFGPDFQHAIHLRLEQSDLENTRNTIAKGQSESRDGNRKRSAYIIHKPSNSGNVDQMMGSSMRVHLLQPHEIESVEREMISYAKGDGMAQSPIVVNLPSSEANFAKGSPYQPPVVLNVPPVVYHSNPNMVRSPNLNDPRNMWSYSNKYPSYAGKIQDLYRKVSMPYKNVQPSFEYKKPEADEGKEQSSLEDVKQPKLESSYYPSFEKKRPSCVTSRPTSNEDKAKPSYEAVTMSAKDESQDTKKENKKEEKP